MKNPALFPVLLVAIILVSGCVSQKQPEQQPAQPSSGSEIAIKDYAFIPGTVTIKKGTTLTWTNMDSVPHQVASDPHPSHTDLPGLESQPLSQVQSYSFTFDKAGTFGYHCHLHPYMKGKIIVEE